MIFHCSFVIHGFSQVCTYSSSLFPRYRGGFSFILPIFSILSRYITFTIQHHSYWWRASLENLAGLLHSYRPIYINIICPGNNRLPCTYNSCSGEAPTSALFRAPQVSPGESTHIPCTSVSPEVYTPVSHNVVFVCYVICRTFLGDLCGFQRLVQRHPSIECTLYIILCSAALVQRYL